MPQPPTNSEKLLVAFVVILSLVALAFTVLSPGFSVDNALVYQGF